MNKAYRTLTWNDRLKIEAWLRVKTPIQTIARELGVHFTTIYREIKRGQYTHLNHDYTTEVRYSPDIAEQKKQAYLRAKGPDLKIGNDHEYAAYLEYKIGVDKYSPGAVLGEIRHKNIEFNTTISRTTFYRYIENGVFLTITSDNLPCKRRKNKRPAPKAARPPRGTSIEKRPLEVNTRETFGEWEMDCVEGKKGTKKTLLVLTERRTRYEIIRLMKDKTAASVVKEIDKIERKIGTRTFRSVFNSITVDNGCEFADCNGIERSVRGGKRTDVYYCHPYSAYERGSNENQNRMIRRHLPKGFNFNKTTAANVRKVEKWLNNYPRVIFDYYTAAELFEAYVNSVCV